MDAGGCPVRCHLGSRLGRGTAPSPPLGQFRCQARWPRWGRGLATAGCDEHRNRSSTRGRTPPRELPGDLSWTTRERIAQGSGPADASERRPGGRFEHLTEAPIWQVGRRAPRPPRCPPAPRSAVLQARQGGPPHSSTYDDNGRTTPFSRDGRWHVACPCASMRANLCLGGTCAYPCAPRRPPAGALGPAGTHGRSVVHAALPGSLLRAVFDGIGLGMAHAAHVGSYGVAAAFGVSVATGQSGATTYGVYSDLGRSRYARGYGRRARAYWCWDEAWDLRWGHHYSGWPGGWWYDHLDFYHDCLSGGLAHAHDRWRWHARQAYRIHRPRGSGVFVSIYVRDPFWRPWGPYWAYDPWGRYWDGYRDGWRDGRWWARGGGVIYAGQFGRPYGSGGVRTVDAGRPSPLAPTRFKEDPRVLATDGGVRRAVPRVQPTPAAAAVDAGRGSPAAHPAPAAPARRGDSTRGERPAPLDWPTDRLRGDARAPRRRSPARVPPHRPRGAGRSPARAPRAHERARPESGCPAAGASRTRPTRGSPPAARRPSRGEAAPARAPASSSGRSAPAPRSDGGGDRATPPVRRPATR